MKGKLKNICVLGKYVLVYCCRPRTASMHSFLSAIQPENNQGSPFYFSSSKSPCEQADCFHFQAVLNLQSFFRSFFFFICCCSAVENIYTYHSLKFEARVEVVVWCTVEEAEGDMELLPWFSVDGETMVGGVEDSQPELAAGDG